MKENKIAMRESSRQFMPLGPVMLDIPGTTLTAADRTRLLHPLTGGVILFARNFESVAQLCALTAEIAALRTPRLLIAVDHEGGRVQRFREGFTNLPPMRVLGTLWDRDHDTARHVARNIGRILAAELRACGVDLSFTPVLDVDFGSSGVIGDRAFHSDAWAISDLAGGLIKGLADVGMASVGKHFPGHGYVRADSHLEIPVDDRETAEIMAIDVVPYQTLIKHGLSAVMPAHVIYSHVDKAPAGFSRFWLQDTLRKRLNFDGVIFSDDLSMEGASVAGRDVVDRANAALHAGCDMVLICNDTAAADTLLGNLRLRDAAATAVSAKRIAKLLPQPYPASLKKLQAHPEYQAAVADIAAIRP